MGQLWVPGFERLKPSSPGGTSDYPDNPARAVAHTTECPPGGHGGDPNYWFHQMHRVLIGKKAEPDLLYDPVTDHGGQYFPLNATGRALQNDGGIRTNRVGKVCIQIEFVGYASRPFTRTWKPGPNFEAMMDAIRSQGVADAWPSGDPPAYPAGHDERSRSVWMSRGGWFGHSQIPSNIHGDPGAIDTRAFFGAAQSTPELWPGWSAFPGRSKVGGGKGRSHPNNLLVKAALIAHGHNAKFGTEVGTKWDAAAASNLEEFQKERKLEEDGVGPETWKALGTMPKEAPAFPSGFDSDKATLSNLVGQSLTVLQGFERPYRGTLTKRWDDNARKALRRFQLSEPRLEGDADGEWGPKSWQLAWTDND